MGFSWLKGNIFAISVSWTFQGGPNVNSFLKQMVQWTTLMKTRQHSKAEEYFQNSRKEVFFLFEGEDGNVIQSPSPVQKRGPGMT